MRSIEQWAAEVVAFLSTFQPKKKRIEAYSYDDQLRFVLTKLSSIREANLGDVLNSLYHFATFWGIPLEKVMPTPEEVASWFEESEEDI